MTTPPPSGPIFIGGTGRSGTWVLGRMLARHPDLVTLDTEIRFHAVPGGFPELLDGRRKVKTFAERLRTWWYRRDGADGTPKGLHLLVPPEVFEPAVETFVARWPRTRRHLVAELVRRTGLRRPRVRALPAWQAAKRFAEAPRAARRAALHDLFSAIVTPTVTAGGGRTWVETTPRNVRAAPALLEIFPGSKVIHTVRDGRDVAASVVKLPWGPDDLIEALEWWGNRMVEAHKACRHADPERLLIIRLEELVSLDREAQFERVVSFVGGDPGGGMRRYFDAHVDATKGNLGRYRSEVPAERLAEFETVYAQQLERLREIQATCMPVEEPHPA